MKRLKDMIQDKQTFMFEVKKKKKDVIFWTAVILITILLFLFFSSKDFSFFLVLSSLVQMFAFIIILVKVTNYQNCSGLSANTLMCYSILLFGRLSSTLFYSGYLPTDSSGSWLYQLSEVVSLLICCLLVYMIYFRFRETSDIMLDNKCPFYYLVIPTYLLAIFIHSNLNYNWFTDINWTFSMFLEACAIFPQILLFSIKKGQIESFTSHYVALCGLSRVFSLIFWWDTYEELESSNSFLSYYTGYFILGSQILQLIIMADYYYLYFMSILKGKALNTMDI